MTRPQFADADLEHPWTKRWRIPVVATPYPSWKYEVALMRETRDWQTIWPTVEEAEVIASLIDYRMEYYNDSWKAKMRERVLDVDGTTNTQIYLKKLDGWYYRRASWQTGEYPYYNTPTDVRAPFTPDKTGLVALIDHVYTIVDHIYDDWLQWKKDHSDVFQQVTA